MLPGNTAILSRAGSEKNGRYTLIQLIASSTYIDQQNMYIRDEHADYIYCLDCGRLKMTHPRSDALAVRMIRDSALLCTCVHPSRDISTGDRVINRILMDLSNSIGKCETVEEAQQLVWRLASREEMNEP
jgi:hypothetical protein